MRIAVFGALGNTGSRVVSEAVARGHRVTAVVRSPEQVERVDAGAVPAVADVTDAFAVGELASRHDLLVSATRPVAGKEFELTAAAKVLLDGVAAVGTRLIVVGGAASLVVPGTQGRMVLDDPRYFHPAAKPIALACNEQLAACVDSAGADWTYVSPAANFAPGRRTGAYRLGTDELVVDTHGESRISMEDLAVALIDEAERPRHRRKRFTVAY